MIRTMEPGLVCVHRFFPCLRSVLRQRERQMAPRITEVHGVHGAPPDVNIARLEESQVDNSSRNHVGGPTGDPQLFHTSVSNGRRFNLRIAYHPSIVP